MTTTFPAPVLNAGPSSPNFIAELAAGATGRLANYPFSFTVGFAHVHAGGTEWMLPSFTIVEDTARDAPLHLISVSADQAEATGLGRGLVVWGPTAERALDVVSRSDAAIAELMAIGDRFAHEVSPWTLTTEIPQLKFDH